ncbi:MAG: YhfC family intramembrane metalloprotease [Clostridium sp.]|nr:YhfC family intramembrane metalloprotease [Clostridium sp.]
MLGYVFALLATVALPLLASLFMAVRHKKHKPVLLGAACFVVFQMLIRIPILQMVLPKWTEFIHFQLSQPVLYLVFLSVTAGLFEEIGRYITMRLFLKEMPLTGAVAFGVGHGGIEALLLVGINFIVIGATKALAIDATTSSLFFMGGVERIFAMVVHISLSIMVWRSLKEEKSSLLFLAIILHTILNLMAGYQAQLGVNPLLIEGSIGLFAGLLLLFTIISVKRMNQRRN